ncbi:hypothetical protein [Streptomyces cyaneofuscatus]|uniref:hypothetical protein n=1 Tax=Streptomyces cyaneofuscatus TaxID=66883 RepID=UPI003807BCEE
MPGTQTTHPTPTGGEQKVELYPPVDDDGWHSSQIRDWIPVCPELSDSAIRLYLILRSLVIENAAP